MRCPDNPPIWVKLIEGVRRGSGVRAKRMLRRSIGNDQARSPSDDNG